MRIDGRGKIEAEKKLVRVGELPSRVGRKWIEVEGDWIENG